MNRRNSVGCLNSKLLGGSASFAECADIVAGRQASKTGHKKCWLPIGTTRPPGDVQGLGWREHGDFTSGLLRFPVISNLLRWRPTIQVAQRSHLQFALGPISEVVRMLHLKLS